MPQLSALEVQGRFLDLWRRFPHMPRTALVLCDYFWQCFPKRNLKKCERAHGRNRLFHLQPRADNVAI